ncbi:MAG: hypothetical protein VYE27_02790 [Pseudomonadota bacterium]|nr:hypothetical protein [Pseudomonadota bacterium]
MRISLLISIAAHASLLFLLLSSYHPSQRELEIDFTPIGVDIISSSKFNALISEEPQVFFDQKPTTPEPLVTSDQVIEVPKDDPEPQIEQISKSEQLIVKDTSYKLYSDLSDTEPELELDLTNLTKLISPDKTEPNLEFYNFHNSKGNERNALKTPEIDKPKPRSADRIDKIAVSKTKSDRVVETMKSAIEASKDANQVEEITRAEAPKEASSEITPEGIKDVEIVASGAIKSSLPPPSRPRVSPEVPAPPVKRPSVSQLLQKKNQTNQIEALLKEATKDNDLKLTVADTLSDFENSKMILAIKQKLEKYWEVGTIAGNSDFEKYVVKVSVKLNNTGEIIGQIIPISPTKPTGRHLIAFRQASNAIISAGSLPIVEEKFPNGLVLELTFDPQEGFTF